jgi:uncharacterized membrane protein (Fun14 family)
LPGPNPTEPASNTGSTPLVSFAGSGVAGFFVGMFLKRVLKFLVIIIGSFLGTVFLVIQWMQARQYIQGEVDWNRVGNDMMDGSNLNFRVAYLWYIRNSSNDGVYYHYNTMVAYPKMYGIHRSVNVNVHRLTTRETNT